MSAIPLFAWAVFRIYYYADLFPNTFYLKDESSYAQGFLYLENTFSIYHWYAIFIVLSIVVLLLRAKRIDLQLRARIMMLVVALAVATYVVRIGGDARHYRYLAFSFCLGSCAFAGILEHAARNYISKFRETIAVVAGLAVGAWSFSLYPPQVSKHPAWNDGEMEILKGISDSHLHRGRTWSHYSNWGKRISNEIIENSRTEGYQLEYETVRVDFWCATHYEHYDYRAMHTLGLTDAILARTVMKSNRPAHKWGLRHPAEDLAAIQRSAASIGQGMYARAVENGTAPTWIEQNLSTIETIERKIFNQHDFLENIPLAFTFSLKIHYREPARGQ